MITCIIVEDAPLAVEKLEGFIKQVPYLQLLQSFDNGLDALHFIQINPVDLVFLDIQMEKFNGLQLMESLQYRPKIIMVSAYKEYAVKGFDNNITDYLLKPYSFERFLKAVEKARGTLQEKPSKNYMFVKTEYRMERINFEDILYIEGKGAYLQIVTKESKVMTLMSFAEILQLLPADNFIRVHKSFIIALNKIENIERNVIKIEKERIPIGKSYQEDFYNKL